MGIDLPLLNYRNGIGLVSLMFSFLCTIKAQKYASLQRTMNDRPLADILHLECLNISKYYKVTDIVVNLYGIMLFFKFNKRIDIFLNILAITYLARLISFSVTILPKCGSMKDKKDDTSCLKIMYNYLTLKYKHIGHNNDLLPIGHVCFMNIFYMYVKKYESIHPSFKKVIFYTNIVNSILIVLSRCHYSIDIYYGYMLSFLVFSRYTYFLKRVAQR